MVTYRPKLVNIQYDCVNVYILKEDFTTHAYLCIRK